MTREDIIRMAIEAKLNLYVNDLTEKQYLGVIEHFAALIAFAEREACAKVCDSYYESWINIHGRYEFMGEGAQECAEAIRARGQV